MREIKFRAWDNKKSMFHYDAEMYGAYQPLFDDGEEFEFVDFILNKDRFIIQQYTGLKDKNGEEIYEGDILRREERWVTNTRLYSVKVDIEVVDWAYVLEGKLSACASFEVMGNIYENAELLERKP